MQRRTWGSTRIGSVSSFDDALVEVTCLNATAVANKSEWPKLIEEIAGHFAIITPQLIVKADSKVQQLSAAKPGIPGIVAICLVHPGDLPEFETTPCAWTPTSNDGPEAR